MMLLERLNEKYYFVGLMRMQKVLAEYSDKYPIIVRRLNPEGSNIKVFTCSTLDSYVYCLYRMY